MKLDILNNNKKLILFFLIFISVISFSNTISKSLINGCDMQWQPSVLFWEGINHYKKFLANKGIGDFLCQNGEYAHLLQILNYPFTLFEWETARILWLILNIFFAFSIPVLICRSLRLDTYKSVLLFLIFMTCYPTRMTLNYGQYSLFVLFFMMLPFIFVNRSSNFLTGLTYVKYSTGYVVFLNLLASKQYKYFILSCLPYLFGWFLYFWYTNSDPVVNFFEPIRLSLEKGYIRDGDLYSLANINFSIFEKISLKILLLFALLIVNFIILIKINKNKDTLFQMSLVLICPLIFFPHSNYDYILLFPLLCYSFLNSEYLINKINIYFVLYFFYLNRIVKHLIDYDTLYQPLILFVMIILLIVNIYSYKNKDSLYFFKLKLI